MREITIKSRIYNYLLATVVFVGILNLAMAVSSKGKWYLYGKDHGVEIKIEMSRESESRNFKTIIRNELQSDLRLSSTTDKIVLFIAGEKMPALLYGYDNRKYPEVVKFFTSEKFDINFEYSNNPDVRRGFDNIEYLLANTKTKVEVDVIFNDLDIRGLYSFGPVNETTHIKLVPIYEYN